MTLLQPLQRWTQCSIISFAVSIFQGSRKTCITKCRHRYKNTLHQKKNTLTHFLHFYPLISTSFERQIDRDRERSFIYCFTHSLNDCKTGWAMLKSGAQHSAQGARMGSREPGTWAITCRLPWCALTGRKVDGNRSQESAGRCECSKCLPPSFNSITHELFEALLYEEFEANS